MPIGDHMEDFERENSFRDISSEISKYCPARPQPLRIALEKIAPTFVAGLFDRRDCLRTLRYIGCTWCPEMPPNDDEFFKLGQIYVGTSFNGATYVIEGYGERPIGSAYFEWIKEDLANIETS